MGGAEPIVAALTDRLLQALDALDGRRGGRLDPWATVVLDEAANICTVPDLPAMYSTAGSRRICLSPILQSRPRGRATWERDGFEAGELVIGATTYRVPGAAAAVARLRAVGA